MCAFKRQFTSIMTQQWNHLLMIHWPIPPALLQPLIPHEFELDTFEGMGWISYILFQVDNMRVYKLPPLPYLATFIELNIRTYVTYNGIRGVYFFSLDANKWPIVIGAKIGALAPYNYANMTLQIRNSTIFSSRKEDSTLMLRNLNVIIDRTLIFSNLHVIALIIGYWNAITSGIR